MGTLHLLREAIAKEKEVDIKVIDDRFKREAKSKEEGMLSRRVTGKGKKESVFSATILEVDGTTTEFTSQRTMAPAIAASNKAKQSRGRDEPHSL